jgi:recombinational DNA repair ATPase RecF
MGGGGEKNVNLEFIPCGSFGSSSFFSLVLVVAHTQLPFRSKCAIVKTDAILWNLDSKRHQRLEEISQGRVSTFSQATHTVK